MKKIFTEKYKLINLGLVVALLLVWAYMNAKYAVWFKGPDALDFYSYYYAIYSPIFVSVAWLAGISGVFLVLPSRMFRLWLFYIVPVFIIATYFLVSGISVYSTNLLNPTRGQMAENCMVVLAVVSVFFVVGRVIYEMRKKKVNEAKG